MEVSDSNRLSNGRASILRVELKNWEKEFSVKNNGKRASREDIRRNPEIAAKYKEYNKIKDAQDHHHHSNSNKPYVKQLPKSRPKIREEESSKALSQRQERFETPVKRKVSQRDEENYLSPSVTRNLFTPSKISLGPTPQKDGQVLGLFDILRENESIYSPKTLETTVIKDPNIFATTSHTTPPKSRVDQDYTNPKLTLTPASSAKRRKLDAFSTPSKNPVEKFNLGETPSSVSKLQFSTPSFLRRDSFQIQRSSKVADNQDHPLSPQPIRSMKRKPQMKGLSKILAELRESQEEHLDEELEALREMEAEEIGIPVKKQLVPKTILSPNSKNVVSSSIQETTFCVKDTSSENTSFKDLSERPDSTAEITGIDSQPIKSFKKKGQKRTTRMVKIKPTRSKPPPTSISTIESMVVNQSNSTHFGSHGMMKIFEDSKSSVDKAATTSPKFSNDNQARNFDSDSQSEYTASEGETRYRRPKQRVKKNKTTATNKEGSDNSNIFNDNMIERDGIKNAATQKVGLLSHQNFRRLKLRNSGAKGPTRSYNSNGRSNRFARKKR